MLRCPPAISLADPAQRLRLQSCWQKSQQRQANSGRLDKSASACSPVWITDKTSMIPKISVCIPTYNGGKYLRECLDGVLSQTFGDFELVIVDDDSKDGTLDIVNEYAAHDRRIKLYRNPRNLGLVGNWNQCFDLAEGEWLKFVFQDDTIDSQCLDILFNRSRPDVPLTACLRSFIYEDITPDSQAAYEIFLKEQSLRTLFPEAGFVPSSRFCRAALERLGTNFIGEPTAVLLHRSVSKRFGTFNPHFVQLCDFEYWARIACNTGLMVVPEVLAGFRIHRGSKTASNIEEHEFRTEIVDPLLLNHEFAYAPNFAPMRSAARALGIDLQRLIRTNVKRTESKVRRMAKDILVRDTKPLAEWTSIVAAFPKLTESRYARLDKLNDGLGRHVTWRFRNNSVRFKKSGVRCPIIVCMDVEPDDWQAVHSQPLPWKGFELASDLFSFVRPLLMSVTGAPVHYTWALRMDQEIARIYGSPDWPARHYEPRMQRYSFEGDELAVSTRARRWDHACQEWIDDYSNPAWIESCVTGSLEAFRETLGRDCYTFRFAGGWMSNSTVKLLEKFCLRYDLSLYGWTSMAGQAHDGRRSTGNDHISSQLPFMPYRPSTGDFTIPDPSRNKGLWIIPLSSARETASRLNGRRAMSNYKPFNLESAPDEFEWLMNKTLFTLERPYLALTVSSAIGVKPRLLRNVKMNFSSLLMHPLADRFVFCTPAEALGMLGYEDRT